MSVKDLLDATVDCASGFDEILRDVKAKLEQSAHKIGAGFVANRCTTLMIVPMRCSAAAACDRLPCSDATTAHNRAKPIHRFVSHPMLLQQASGFTPDAFGRWSDEWKQFVFRTRECRCSQERVQLIQHIEGYQEDIRELVWLLEELDDERQSCADTLQSLIADIDQDRSETSILFIAGSFEDKPPSREFDLFSCIFFRFVLSTLRVRAILVDRGAA